MAANGKFCPYCGKALECQLSIESAAKLLDCSPQFFRNLIRRGEIGFSKIGRMVRIPHSEIHKLIDYHPRF